MYMLQFYIVGECFFMAKIYNHFALNFYSNYVAIMAHVSVSSNALPFMSFNRLQCLELMCCHGQHLNTFFYNTASFSLDTSHYMDL